MKGEPLYIKKIKSKKGSLSEKSPLCVIFNDAFDYHKSYLDFASAYSEYFNQTAHEIWIVDLPGYGLSPGTRGQPYNLEELKGQLNGIKNELKNEMPDRPFFLLGQGVSALLFLNLLSANNFFGIDGAIILNPLLKLKNSFLLKSSLRLGFVKEWAPTIPTFVKFSGKDLRRGTQSALEYDKDPLNHQRMSMGLIHQIIELGRVTRKKSHLVNIPIYFILGDRSPLSCLDASESYYKGLRRPGSSFWRIPQGKHDLMNDVKNQEIYNNICKWIEERSSL